MKIGFRKPSIKKMIGARTSWKRVVRHNMWLKAPRWFWAITNPKKYFYNKAYSKFTFGLSDIIKLIGKFFK